METEEDVQSLLAERVSWADDDGAHHTLSAEVANLQPYQDPPAMPILTPDVPPKQPLYNRCWFRDLRPWQVLLMVVIQIFLLLINVALAGVFLVGWLRSHGQCVLGVEFLPSGGMGDTSSPYWCDQVIYVSFAAISVLFTCIMVNWTAQLAASHRWLVIQLTIICVSVLATASYFGVYVYKFQSWCWSMKASVACQPEETTCDKKRRAIHTCYDAARFFDIELMKEESILNAYWIALYELVLVMCSLVPWLGLVAICAERLKTACVKRESKLFSRIIEDEESDENLADSIDE